MDNFKPLSAHAIGRSGEKLALSYLEKNKYRVIEKGFRLYRGEIDLICLDGAALVFVEVKTRRSQPFSLPEESVTPAKQDQIRKIAAGYLQKNGLHDVECRFDVISVIIDEDLSPSISHIKNAF